MVNTRLLFLLLKRREIARFLPFLLGSFFLFGCPPAGLKGWVFYKDDIRYRIGELDPHWRNIRISENDLAFQSTRYEAAIQINSTCRKDYEDVSLQILTDHVFHGLQDRKIVLQERRRLDDREALYTEITAKMDGKMFKAAIIVLKKNRCIYDLTYITQPWNFGRGVGDYYRVVSGFRVLSIR